MILIPPHERKWGAGKFDQSAGQRGRSLTLLVGDRVCECGDFAHVGTVEDIDKARGFARVRWHRSYASRVKLARLISAAL